MMTFPIVYVRILSEIHSPVNTSGKENLNKSLLLNKGFACRLTNKLLVIGMYRSTPVACVFCIFVKIVLRYSTLRSAVFG